jgi:hypothetical protein
MLLPSFQASSSFSPLGLSEDSAFGETKVFFSDSVLALLQAQQVGLFETSAVILQSFIRYVELLLMFSCLLVWLVSTPYIFLSCCLVWFGLVWFCLFV